MAARSSGPSLVEGSGTGISKPGHVTHIRGGLQRDPEWIGAGFAQQARAFLGHGGEQRIDVLPVEALEPRT